MDAQGAGAVANDAALTAEQRAFIGKAFTAYDATGKPCPAVVKSLSVRALVIPHFSVGMSFDDRETYPDPAAAQKAKPEIFYDLAGAEGRYLFGHFESPCPGTRWAVEGSAIAVVPKSESPKEHPAALAAFRALPAYGKVQAELASKHPEEKARPWEAYDDGYSGFDVFRPEKGAPLVVVSAIGGSGCSDFYASVSAIFDTSDAARPASRGVMGDASTTTALRLLAAVDLDGNGEFEFVTGPDSDSERFALIRPSGKGSYVREEFFFVPNLDCPC
jgi:hypothetical protein